jgi:hypothetical protein
MISVGPKCFSCRILGTMVPSLAMVQTRSISPEFPLIRTLFSLRWARAPSAVLIMAWRWSGLMHQSTLTCTNQAGRPTLFKYHSRSSKSKCNAQHLLLHWKTRLQKRQGVKVHHPVSKQDICSIVLRTNRFAGSVPGCDGFNTFKPRWGYPILIDSVISRPLFCSGSMTMFARQGQSSLMPWRTPHPVCRTQRQQPCT